MAHGRASAITRSGRSDVPGCQIDDDCIASGPRRTNVPRPEMNALKTAGADHATWKAAVLTGDIVGLRARHHGDVPVLQSGLYDDVVTRSRADSRPWRPIPPDSVASPYAVRDPADEVAAFSVIELSSQALAGEALLWGIDAHNRTAHIGVAVLPEFRRRGFGTDTTRVLCHYGFITLGLHRLQVETAADNTSMIHAANRAGFSTEGLLRRSCWANGSFLDEMILGQLSEEWRQT